MKLLECAAALLQRVLSAKELIDKIKLALAILALGACALRMCNSCVQGQGSCWSGCMAPAPGSLPVFGSSHSKSRLSIALATVSQGPWAQVVSECCWGVPAGLECRFWTAEREGPGGWAVRGWAVLGLVLNTCPLLPESIKNRVGGGRAGRARWAVGGWAVIGLVLNTYPLLPEFIKNREVLWIRNSCKLRTQVSKRNAKIVPVSMATRAGTGRRSCRKTFRSETFIQVLDPLCKRESLSSAFFQELCLKRPQHTSTKQPPSERS